MGHDRCWTGELRESRKSWYRPDTDESVAKGDFDEDGDLDVVVANSGEASLSLFKGDGIAHFATGIPIYGVGDGPVAVIASDFNGDGHLDVAALRKGTCHPTVR
ncbi:MAG: VCBS repeat-containing protein [Deltaproteobacteria bacterium]|nr:VCBS repeat-containing protein [Deltaproteobacteria bacterium]